MGTGNGGTEQAAILGREVVASREGRIGGTTSTGIVMTATLLGVALPSVRALRRLVWVTYQGRSIKVPVLDVGPWFEHDDEYVFGSFPPAAVRQTVPIGETNPGTQRTARNDAGIDLFDATCKALGVAPENWGLRTVTWGWAD